MLGICLRRGRRHIRCYLCLTLAVNHQDQVVKLLLSLGKWVNGFSNFVHCVDKGIILCQNSEKRLKKTKFCSLEFSTSSSPTVWNLRTQHSAMAKTLHSHPLPLAGNFWTGGV